MWNVVDEKYRVMSGCNYLEERECPLDFRRIRHIKSHVVDLPTSEMRADFCLLMTTINKRLLKAEDSDYNKPASF